MKDKYKIIKRRIQRVKIAKRLLLKVEKEMAKNQISSLEEELHDLWCKYFYIANLMNGPINFITYPLFGISYTSVF